mmetsp:Transcript_49905/g.108962  ORF Transcript_49905/g.108962 Transcript_49905/m.108962 type:complete len:905 (-) Transcript_49905:83-2797(-)
MGKRRRDRVGKGSAMFVPARTIGVVTDSTPFAAAVVGKTRHLVVSKGTSFQIYDAMSLRVLIGSRNLGERIRSMVALGGGVVAVATLTKLTAESGLQSVASFAGWSQLIDALYAVTPSEFVSVGKGEILVWRVPAAVLGHNKGPPVDIESSGRLVLPLGDDVSFVLHVPTYLHKILVASRRGTLQLWNTRSHKLVHEFSGHKIAEEDGHVTRMVHSPDMVGLVALGYSSGRIVIFDVEQDRAHFSLQQTQGSVTALSFRTDGVEPALLCSGSPSGTLCLWALQKRRCQQTIQAHDAAIVAAEFLEGQTLIVSSGADNALRMWSFDDGGKCLRLKERVGLCGPVRGIGYYPFVPDTLIAYAEPSEGKCSLGSVVTRNSHCGGIMSQKKLSPLEFGGGVLGPVVDMDYCSDRHFDWPAIVTAHRGCSQAAVWDGERQALTAKALGVKGHTAAISSIAVSGCGHFAVLGAENGWLHKFHLQSATFHGSMSMKYNKKGEAMHAPHTGKVLLTRFSQGVTLISCSAAPGEARLLMWDVKTRKQTGSLQLEDGNAAVQKGIVSGIYAAVALSSSCVIIADVAAMAVARKLLIGGSSGASKVVSMAFNDGHRLLAVGTSDARFRIYDVASARLIDLMAFSSPALSCAFSPGTLFMMTSHARSSSPGAIHMWANRNIFSVGIDQELDVSGVNVNENDDLEPQDTDDFFTVGSGERSKWQMLVDYDTVKERNSAKDETVKPVQAPFFLPTVAKEDDPRQAVFAAVDDVEDDEPEETTFADRMAGDLQRRLKRRRVGDTEAGDVLSWLRTKSIGALHAELAQVGPLSGGSMDEVEAMLDEFSDNRGRTSVDACQSILSTFLKFHGETIADDGSDVAKVKCRELSDTLRSEWRSIDDDFARLSCALRTFARVQMD